ncbi:hypothetical protein [[Phormidium] sp. ETS-05]|nr:hypothetical protein [[Phormidium] sp. ETS-05]
MLLANSPVEKAHPNPSKQPSSRVRSRSVPEAIAPRKETGFLR